jgi:tetratricopeptide (TPR) repeat protein
LTNIGLAYSAQAGVVGKPAAGAPGGATPVTPEPIEVITKRRQDLFLEAHCFMQEAYEIRVNRLPMMLTNSSSGSTTASSSQQPDAVNKEMKTNAASVSTANESAYKLDQQVAKYQLASILTNLSRYEEAEALIVDSIQQLTTMSRKEGLTANQQQRFLIFVVTALTHYAHLLSAQQRYQEADQCFEQAFLTRKQLFGEKHMETLTVITHWMISKASRGDEDGAREFRRQLYKLLDHPDGDKI